VRHEHDGRSSPIEVLEQLEQDLLEVAALARVEKHGDLFAGVLQNKQSLSAALKALR